MKKIVRTAQAKRKINPVSIACINKAKTDLGVPLPVLAAALQKCYDKYFLPVWGYPSKAVRHQEGKNPRIGCSYISIPRIKPVRLGYHDLTKKGQPISKVFVKTTLDDNQLVSVTACHELFRDGD